MDEPIVRKTLKFNLTSALIRMCVLALVSTALMLTSVAQSLSPSGRHFIVLIDDSCSIGGCSNSTNKRQAIAADLPGRLFGGTSGIKGFDPAADTVSVLFFTIGNGAGQCGTRGPRSVLPKNIFDLAYTGKLRSKDDFAVQLQQWMSDECRFKGNWSPIVISSLLVLPFMDSKLGRDELHSQTFLLQVTDGEFNSRATPGHELTDYRRLGTIDHVADADNLLSQVSKLFTLKMLPHQPPVKGVFYLAAEYTSQRPPESAIQYQRNSLLYPQALSPSELRYRLNDQLPGDIQLLSQGKGSGFDFKPLWLRVGFEDAQSGEWSIGGWKLPRLSESTKRISLATCQPPQCEVDKKNDRIGVGLFEAGLGGPLKVPRSADDPRAGRIKFSVGFHYQTDIYNHLCVETPELVINADPAPPTVIPNLVFPPSRLGKSEVAAEWSRDEDGITTQEEAKNRILARRNIQWLLRLIAFVILAALVMIFLFLRYHSRAFDPQLKWVASPNVIVDFNQPASSPMLVGTLQVVNDQPVPWLGRLLKNDEQPTRHAEISLNYNYFEQSGLSLSGQHPIGFVRAASKVESSDELDRTTVETVSDGREIYIFLAAEKINDYEGETDDTGDAQFTIPVTAQMNWTTQHPASEGRGSWISRGLRILKAYVASERPGSLKQDIQCSLIVKPEKPSKPVVIYHEANDEKLYFKNDDLVQIGTFMFESQTSRRFAKPYRWSNYTIQTYQGNRPLGGEPIMLERPEVEVKPQERLPVPVFISCDSQTIPNPDPVDAEYSFQLIGDYSAESKPGPHYAVLYRDPTSAEIELRLMQPNRQLEVFWTPEGRTRLRTLPDRGDANELLSEENTIQFETQPIKFDSSSTHLRELLRLEIGNSGSVGEGVVEVELACSINCSEAVRNSIEMEGDYTLDELVDVYDFNTPDSKVAIKEGETVQSRAVRLQPGFISRIVSGRIHDDLIAAEIDLTIRVVDDQQRVTERALKVVLPFSLEQLPGLNWLAIDFGTSAISAALGSGRGDNVMMIPLQHISVKDGLSFAQYDIENPERDSPDLLPSWICCNADLRQKSGDKSRPGFPGYFSEHLSMTPGNPDFIGLPAVTHEFEEHSGRIIYSLKSWLGKLSRNIPIRVRENGREVEKRLPLEPMVESGFAALARAYLFESDYHADQIVIAYPNTFTQRHRDILHKVAYRALGPRFRIPLDERIRLISESEAVAYHYCAEQVLQQPRVGKEFILVYDFGAGTLDLSLIKVEWSEGSRYPIHWSVGRPIGVPVAGNHIDEILARIVHDVLSDARFVDPGTFEYRFSVVGRVLNRLDPDFHRKAISGLWTSIRAAKHEWSNACRRVLDSGGDWADCPPLRVRVGTVGGTGSGVIEARDRARLKALTEPTDEPGLWVADDVSIFLSIPSWMVKNDGGMSQFLEFVTDEVVNELLTSEGVTPEEIDTVIVSGRGALYPELRERVWRQFRNAATPDLFSNNTMKNAVALGAIARQALSRAFHDDADRAVAPQLGVLFNDGHDLRTEDDWDQPIDLTASPTFRLVQINLHKPNPREDLRSLRKHFYVDLSSKHFVRDDILGEDKNLYIRKEIRNGELAIYLWGKDVAPTPVFTEDQIAQTVTTPPWPVGHPLLDPLG